MNKKVSILELFPGITVSEELEDFFSGTELLHADIKAEKRSIRAEFSSPRYIRRPVLTALERQAALEYGLRRVRLVQRCPEKAFSALNTEDLRQVLIDDFPPAAGITANCSWERTDTELLLHINGNGVAELRPHLRAAEEYMKDTFGTFLPIRIVPRKRLETKEELFAELELVRREAMNAAPAAKAAAEGGPAASHELIYGKPFKDAPIPMKDVSLDSARVCVEGEVFSVQHKELPRRNAVVVSFFMTDHTGSVWVNKFMENAEAKPILEKIHGPNPKKHKPGSYIRVRGQMTVNKFDNEPVLAPYSIQEAERPARKDTAEEKRVELHLHTNMSNMDALTDTDAAVRLAAKWGHKAIAITDHGVAHSFPAALHAADDLAKAGTPIKILYGCEGYYFNDVDDRIAIHGESDADFDGEYIAFDLETTGLFARRDKIIEIGAAKMRHGEVLETYETFVAPGMRVPQKTVDLTGITDDMLVGAPSIGQVLPEFLRFCGDLPLIAHNADFDVGFIAEACRQQGIPYRPVYADTLVLSQNLLSGLSNYKLNTVADYLGLPEFNHHRASDDAVTCGHLFFRLAEKMREMGLFKLSEVNPAMVPLRSGMHKTGRHNRHIILFAKNNLGLRNLYRLISDGFLQYYKTVPRIPKSELLKYREGILIGSACEAGELFQAVIDHKSDEELRRLASFYDFLEIQPLSNNMFMLADGKASSEEELREFNRTVVRLGEELGKPVVATGDVHFLNPEDEIFRHILLASKDFKDCDRDNPLYFRSTDDMLKEFAYFGEEKAKELVITNPNLIADMCETLRPVPYNLFAPKIENSVEDLKSLVYGKLHRLYGENPPELIANRVETELNDIINCHYDVIYMSAQKLVQNSLEHGYLVGSRGSVGSSLVAYMSGITEVNSLPPHYRCPNPACKYTDFDVPEGCNCGADLPDRTCPLCGEKFEKDGFNIPFETFLGFGGDKVPDIDLNFSGEYQASAHAYCVEMFGKTHVFRAGTISGVAEKTAYGYAKKYLAERNLNPGRAEEERLAAGCVGVKRTTGQHPGGLVVIPQENEIWDFCPVQHPADDPNSDWITTHFEYHSMEENLLKLDMLGHDDPTMIRMLQDMTGVDPQKIPLDDKDTMSIFTSSKVLGYEDDKLLGPTGAVGIPEFGTGFTRGMLVETQPTQFDTLLRLSGFSHGTDVWLGNARDLILSKTATVGQAIGCRDDIMLYLIRCGMPEKRSFKIMEAVRKGRGLPEGAEDEMKAAGVPDWYIGSCKKIKYLFPKAHAVAYVMMAFRIAWFKVHRPLAYYSAYFYRRSQKGGFDADMMCRGKEKVTACINAINANENATAKDDDLLTTLEVCYEFYLRGFSFAPISLYQSDALKFIPQEDGRLLTPFIAVSGLGETAAKDIVEGRRGKKFISIEEFSNACPKVSQTHIENLKAAGAFGNLPETSQITLF